MEDAVELAPESELEPVAPEPEAEPVVVAEVNPEAEVALPVAEAAEAVDVTSA